MRPFHTHSGIVAHDDVIGSCGRVDGRRHHGAAFRGAAPDPGRGRPEDAPRCPGHLSQGPRRHPAGRRHRAGHAGARGGRGVGGAVDGAVARRGGGGRVRGPRRLRGRGRANVAAWMGDGASYRVEERDVYEGIEERGLDRVVLDLPEPWRALGPDHRGPAPGRDPAVLSAVDHPGRHAARRHGRHGPSRMAETSEVLRRTWHVEERSVRPDHRMVAHTGFLTTARLLVAAGRPPVGRTHGIMSRNRQGPDGAVTARRPARGFSPAR